jgi:UDP-2,3-diacylglucosamine pyrophosphatase LpxH
MGKGVGMRLWLVLALILAGGCAPARESEKTAAPTGTHFYFAQLSDTHWGAKDGIAMTRSAVELISQLPVRVEFVAVTGDLFADSIRNEQMVRDGVAVLKALKVPVYCVPGNHDVLQDDFSRTQALFDETFGVKEQRVVIKGVACLFLSSEIPPGEKRSAWQSERATIEKLIGASTGPALIFLHRPPLRDVLGNEEKGAGSWSDVADSQWLRLFEKYPGVKGVFAGHFHRDEMIWIGAVPVYVAPALARFWDRQPSFRLYEYQDGRINYWTLYPERPPRK